MMPAKCFFPKFGSIARLDDHVAIEQMQLIVSPASIGNVSARIRAPN